MGGRRSYQQNIIMVSVSSGYKICGSIKDGIFLSVKFGEGGGEILVTLSVKIVFGTVRLI